ncbi:MAG: Jag N-terminal domain-containing protein [Anaerolineae bacterium]|nr:Jag N-terminal domain-containing protein [Anaerolineae bacterium]
MSELKSIEVTGNDVNAAIARGLSQLNLPREAVIVDVIDSGSRGILGIGSRPARVRILVREAEEPEDEPEPAVVTAVPPSPPPPAPAKEAPAPAPVEAVKTEKPAPPPRPEPASVAVPVAFEAYDEDEDEDEEYRPAAVLDYDNEEDAKAGTAALEELLEKMQIAAKVHVYRADPVADEDIAPWVLEIRGRDLGILIGRRGETLSAIQYITRLIASRDLQRRVNVIIDVEGYKVRRAEQLRKLALRMADQAVRTERTMKLEPMPPYERRIVHIALRGRADVTTQSVGEGDRRRVTIIPA